MTDIKYEEERNKLIPVAEKYADKVCRVQFGVVPTGSNKTVDDYNAKWSRAFHSKMNELAKGL